MDNGVKIGLVTSDSMINAEYALKVMDIIDYFSCIIGHENGRGSKETGIPAITAMNSIESFCDNTIVIGDAPIDLQMAKNANLKAGILVASGQIPYDMLKIESEYVARNMREIGVSNAKK
jgi:phosphoglycolate phosphatase